MTFSVQRLHISKHIAPRVIKAWVEKQKCFRNQEFKISNYCDQGQIGILDLLAKSRKLKTLEITNECIVYLDNVHRKCLKSLKSLTIINSVINQREQSQSNIYEMAESIINLSISYVSEENLETLIVQKIPQLSQLESLSASPGLELKVKIPLQSIIQWIKIMIITNKHMREARLEVNEIQIYYKRTQNDINFYKMSIFDCLKQVGNQNGMEIETSQNDQVWIEISITFKNIKWIVMTYLPIKFKSALYTIKQNQLVDKDSLFQIILKLRSG
ncbi:hypothetical protein FGO68_gene4087 [Halteria grandinella]|uniref:Uncharacterized protein n=1 Tax=Halteria grandinella TaxID=5974 RepID=A0A8J8T7K6_HALGN|nr:hypothetical protein FGO68_gene4087 [Halteria grandinella]